MTENTEGDIFPQIFPPFPPNLDKRQDIKPMDIISNLEVTKKLEFDHQYSNDMIENLPQLRPSVIAIMIFLNIFRPRKLHLSILSQKCKMGS